MDVNINDQICIWNLLFIVRRFIVNFLIRSVVASRQTKWFSSEKYDPFCPISFFKRTLQSVETLFGRCKKETRRVMIYRNGKARGRKKCARERDGTSLFPSRVHVIFGKFRDVDIPGFKEVVCRARCMYGRGGYPIKMQPDARAT